MDYFNEFNRIMTQQEEIALATCTDENPDVRIVNFVYAPNRSGIVYFASFPENRKIKEIQSNQNVSFTTIPRDGTEHVRSINAIARKSDLTILDLEKKFCDKIPSYEFMIQQFGNVLILFEIQFSEAIVVLDFNNIEKISL